MRLSEAIRLGAMLKPQDYVYLLSDDGKTCALGAACDALGVLDIPDDDRGSHSRHQLFVRYPFLHDAATCPACGPIQGRWRRWRGDEYDVEDVIAHLNDDHEWTRERIAEWVAGVESAHETPAVIEHPQPVSVEV